MASELYVETLRGLTSGANANKVIIPSGQTLDASAGTLAMTPSPGQIVQAVTYSNPNIASTATANSPVAMTTYQIQITPVYANSKIIVEYYIPVNNTSAGGGNVVMWIAAIRAYDGGAWSRTAVTSGGTSGTAGLRFYGAGHNFRKLNGYDQNDNQAEHFKCYDEPGVTTPVNYSFEYFQETSNSGTTIFGGSNFNGTAWGFNGGVHINAMEIKQ